MSGTATVTAVLRDAPYLVSLSDDLGHVWSADEPANLGGGNTGTVSQQGLANASSGLVSGLAIAGLQEQLRQFFETTRCRL